MPDHQTIAPHGGTLVDLLVPGEQRDRARTEADHLPKLVVSERELSDLEIRRPTLEDIYLELTR